MAETFNIYHSPYTKAEIEAQLENASPVIDTSTNHWKIWDIDENSYVDTGVSAVATTLSNYYYASSPSGTETPTTWQDTIPEVPTGHYLWTKYHWSNGLDTYTKCKNGMISCEIEWGQITGTLANQSDLNTALQGKQPIIDSSNKLSADLVEDGSTNKVVSQTEKNTWNSKQDAITTLDVAHGGTGANTLASGEVLVGNGTGAVSTKGITDNASGGVSINDTNLVTARSVANQTIGFCNRTNWVSAANENYTTLMARGESLNTSDTTPAVNGAIAWTYN